MTNTQREIGAGILTIDGGYFVFVDQDSGGEICRFKITAPLESPLVAHLRAIADSGDTYMMSTNGRDITFSPCLTVTYETDVDLHDIFVKQNSDSE